MEASLNEGLLVARTVPGLETEDLTAEGDNEATRRDAYEKIGERIKEAADRTLKQGVDMTSNLTVTVPGYPLPSSGLSRKEELERAPIELATEVDYPVGFPLSMFTNSIRMRVRASGFREPRGESTSAVAVDCQGNLLQPGVTPVQTGCRCPQSTDPNAYWDPNLNRCACSVPNSSFVSSANGGRCVCTTGFQDPNPDDSSLICNCPGVNCTGNQYAPPGSCQCQDCGSGREPDAFRSSCVCRSADVASCNSGNGYVDNYTCACNRCESPAVLNDSRSGCVCQPSQIDSAIQNNARLGDRCEQIPCTGDLVSSSDGRSCGCPAAPANAGCLSGQSWVQVGDRCQCGCPNGGVYINDGTNSGCAPARCQTTRCRWDAGQGKWIADE